MNDEKLPYLNELCHLAKLRNEINTRRHRARFRKNHYAKALRIVEAHLGSNYELRHIEGQLRYYSAPAGHTAQHQDTIKRLRQRKADIEKQMEWLRQKHPSPKKWQAMGRHKLRSLILQGEGEYAMAKHETMEFSIKHRSRVKYLMSKLACSVHYDNGALNAIRFKDGSDDFFDLESINHHAELYELDKAVTNMVEE